MRILKFLVSAAMITGFTLTSSDASSPLHQVTEDAFFEAADNMKFKDLRSFALTDKAAKERVKKYFNYRKGKIQSVECPTLTKQWILSHDRASLEQGSIGTTPAVRENPMTHPIVELNGQNWGVAGLNVKDFSEDKSEETDYRPEKRMGGVFNISKPDADGGPRITKTCFYKDMGSKKTGSVLLYLEEEYLNLD